MPSPRPVFVFGSQGPAAFVEQLLALTQTAGDNAQLSAFFQLALDAVRNEVLSITDHAQLAVLPDISKFTSIKAMCLFHESTDYKNPVLNGVLLVILQAAQAISTVESPSTSALLDPRAQFAGFCTGAITAAALAAATDGAWDVTRQAVEAIRLVFWLSLCSAQAAKRHAHVPSEESLPWSYAISTPGASDSGAGTADIEKAIESFNSAVCADDTKSKIVATAFTTAGVSVGGPPARLRTFADWINAKGAGIAARASPLRIFSPYHNEELLDGTVEAVMNHVRRRDIQLLGGRKLARTLYDIVSGAPVDMRSDEQLVRYLVESNLVKCNRFDLVCSAIADTVVKEHGPVSVLCAAPSLGLGAAVVDKIKSNTATLDVTLEDLGAKVNAKASGGPPFASAENEDIAIVAMSCRLPGNISTPEEFWSFIKAGKSAIGEIPKHLFDIDDYYGDGLNQTRVRYMHALSEDVVKTMDLRIPNISPKEAEQMDPQHRLAILCAYEALERAGYSPAASQSFDNRRIAYFAAVTSDDYRENAMSAPGGISSYFISGCIRAFVPGALSFALALEGPSNSIDSGETSSILTLEHARHALLARQCDVALAGGFTVLTAPLNFLGMDVDGLLSHGDRDTTFSADHDGVIRGDGAVVLVLKRLSDAVAEGDEILATLPTARHRTFTGEMTADDQASFLKSALAEAGMHKDSVAHVEAAGYFNAQVEAAEYKALHCAFGPGQFDKRVLSVGSVRPNLGASEAAMNMVQVMKAVLMLKHRISPAMPKVERLIPEIQTISSTGKTILSFEERQLPTGPNTAIAVHGLALAGNEAVALVRSPPQLISAPEPEDHRGAHVFSLSAKSAEAIEQMRINLIDYVSSHSPDLLRLSYTLMARRLVHPFRITVHASTLAELQERLQSTQVTEIREQTKRLQPVIHFADSIDAEIAQKLCLGDKIYRQAFEGSVEVLNALGIKPSSGTATSLSSLSVRANLALLALVQRFGIAPVSVAAFGHSSIVALVAAKVLSPPEALFLACLLDRPQVMQKMLKRIASRAFAIDIQVGGVEIAAGTLLTHALELVVRQLFSTEQKQTQPACTAQTCCLSVGASPWAGIAAFLSELHSSAAHVDWCGVFATFLPGLRYLNDLPSYPFTLTRHWIEYTDRNLIRSSDESQQSIVMDAALEEVHEKVLPTPSFPMLGRLVQISVQGDPHEQESSAVYESLISAEPMVKFITGHLVNGVALAPATLWADLCMEAAIDVAQKSDRWDDTQLQPELKNLEIIRPLTIVNDASLDPQHLRICVEGSLSKAIFNITIASNAPSGALTKHMCATVEMERKDKVAASWSRFSPLIASRYLSVRESPRADVISSKLAYSAFETVVAYTEGSGFRGIESVAMLEDTFEAATVVKMSSDAPSSKYAVNPCYIDSLGQITGFICNSTCDTENVYLADGVAAMRFGTRLVEAAEQGETLHAYCRMQPHDEGAYFLGDAFFMDSSLEIVGEMEGVRYKKVPRTVLQVLLPNPAKKAPAKPQLHRPSGTAAGQALSGTPSAQLGSKTLAQAEPKVERILATVLEAVAVELGIDVDQLQPSTSFADLGLDSLMAIVILGSLTNMPIELPPSLFLDCLTPDDVRRWLFERIGTPTTDMTDTSDDFQEAREQVTTGETSGHADEALAKARQVIATELGIEEGDLGEDTDLADLGLDSLMSLLVLGTLNAELGLELPPSLFIDRTNLKQLRQYFAETMGGVVPSAVETGPPAAAAPSHVEPENVRTVPAALLQKCERGPNLFLFPDGSGAAAAYGGLPKLGNCSLYGLNSPFMADPTQWSSGVHQLARAYIQSIKMVQPRGPYYLGGWSFGGVAAFEACRLLQTSGDPSDRVELLLLLDSPSPARYPPLPMSIVDWIFSSADIPTPPTLSKRLVAHFQATVEALERLGVPEPLNGSAQPSRVVLLTARNGLNVKQQVRDQNATVKWLVQPRSGLGANGWDTLLPGKRVIVKEFDANHFTMMHEPYIQQLARLIAEACKT